MICRSLSCPSLRGSCQMQPDTVSVNTALSALSRGGVKFAQKRPPVWNTPFFRYSVARDISACRTLAGGKSLDFWTSHFSSSTWNCGQWSQLPLELLPSVWPQLEKAEVKPQCLVHFFNLGQLQCNTWQKLQQRTLRIHCALAFADT